MNFKVPGNPAYKTHMVIMAIPSIGVICNTPDISTTFLELKRLCRQSTIKNIKADKAPCVAENKIPPSIALVSPQQNVKNIKFISCIVP